MRNVHTCFGGSRPVLRSSTAEGGGSKVNNLRNACRVKAQRRRVYKTHFLPNEPKIPASLLAFSKKTNPNEPKLLAFCTVKCQLKGWKRLFCRPYGTLAVWTVYPQLKLRAIFERPLRALFRVSRSLTLRDKRQRGSVALPICVYSRLSHRSLAKVDLLAVSPLCLCSFVVNPRILRTFPVTRSYAKLREVTFNRVQSSPPNPTRSDPIRVNPTIRISKSKDVF